MSNNLPQDNSRTERIANILSSLNSYELDQIRLKLNVLDFESKIKHQSKNKLNIFLHTYILILIAMTPIILMLNSHNILTHFSLNYIINSITSILFFSFITTLTVFIPQVMLTPLIYKTMITKTHFDGYFETNKIRLNSIDCLEFIESVLLSMNNLKIESKDNFNNMIVAKTNFSIMSSGEIINIMIQPLSENLCQYTVYSKYIFPTFDTGINIKNVKNIINEIQSHFDAKKLISESSN